MDGKDINKLKNKSLTNLNTYLTNLILSNDEKDMKKAKLLSYWLNTYTQYLKKEKTFLPEKLIKYNRGDIVKIDFGFNIGSEEGGLHYAVVIDNNNSKKSNTITVVPLSSIRAGRKIHSTSVKLGNEIFKSLISKHDRLSHVIQKELSEISTTIIQLKSESANVKNDPSFLANLNILESRLAKLKNKDCELNNLLSEIQRMKTGSIALVGQITTISKIRIYDPLYSNSVLKGIRLAPTTMDLINDRIKELFIYGEM